MRAHGPARGAATQKAFQRSQRGGAVTKWHLNAKTQRSQRTESAGGDFLERRNFAVFVARESTQNATKLKVCTAKTWLAPFLDHRTYPGRLEGQNLAVTTFSTVEDLGVLVA